MNRQETARVLHIFHTVYRTEITEDMESLWSNVFAAVDPAVVTAAAKDWILTEKWWPTPAEFSTYMRAARSESQAALPATHGCDGSGWIDHPDIGLDPCPTCNPALTAIFAESALVDRWRNGEAIGRLVDPNRYPSVPTCKPTVREDPQDPIRRRPVKAIRL